MLWKVDFVVVCPTEVHAPPGSSPRFLGVSSLGLASGHPTPHPHQLPGGAWRPLKETQQMVATSSIEGEVVTEAIASPKICYLSEGIHLTFPHDRASYISTDTS